jgi:hypothetical protein
VNTLGQEPTIEQRLAQIEARQNEQEQRSRRSPNEGGFREGLTNLSMGQYNPFITRSAGRIIMQIPFDDSIDGSNAHECFFQMPTRSKAIAEARVWVQQKSFRRYVASLAETSTGGSTHQHTLGGSGGLTTDSANGPDPHTHDYDVPTVTSVDSGSSNHAHSVSLTTGIFETAASGTMSLFVADDGTNYGSALTSGVTSITDQDLKSQLTKTSGNKRIKITATGLMRVQVLLLLDLRVSVIG